MLQLLARFIDCTMSFSQGVSMEAILGTAIGILIASPFWFFFQVREKKIPPVPPVPEQGSTEREGGRV